MPNRDVSESQIGASTTGVGGGTLGDTAGTGGGTGASLNATRRPKTENFRKDQLKFQQNQNEQIMTELNDAEEERLEAQREVQRLEAKKQQVMNEYKQLQLEREAAESKCDASSSEICQRNERVSMLMGQNRQIIDMLEQEEKVVAQRTGQLETLVQKQEDLQKISDQFDRIRETGNQQLASAHTEIAKTQEDLRNSQAESAQLREAEINLAAQAKVDIEVLDNKLRESKDCNVQHLQQIQHNEVHEHRLEDGIQKLKASLEELTVQKKGIRMQLDTDANHRDKWTQSKAEVERRKENLQRTVEALRASLRASEDHNNKMQEDNRAGGENFRQLGDRVYALMDQLRTNQVELKKQEHAGIDKQRKISSLDKEQAKLTTELEQEVDAKLAAESEARQAAQMQALLQKKNKHLEEALHLALKAQEKVEKRLAELQDKTNALESQNEYLGSRLDGNEEDKGALRYSHRRVEEELRQVTRMHSELLQQRTELEDKLSDIEVDKASKKAELDYIKREDMLDESGRTKPILIESESKLIERLQINEFLYSAQQTRNPVPMIIEKVSHILEALHTSHTQADTYLQDLQRSNSMLTALRGKNSALYEKVQLCETWKMRALLKIASNEFENRADVKGHQKAKKTDHKLYLDGLQYTNKELTELHRVISSYNKAEMVKEIHLQDNSLDASSADKLIDLLELCPYVEHVDIRRNRINHSGIDKIKSHLERMPGVTDVRPDPATGDLTAKSGGRIMLQILVSDQVETDEGDQMGTAQSREDLFADGTGEATDAFLSSAAGLTNAQQASGPAATGVPGAKDRSIMAPQRGGLSSSTPSLPPIAGGNRPGSGRR